MYFFNGKFDKTPTCLYTNGQFHALSLFQGCQSDEFTCSNGQCIPDNEECDGNSDCNDNSDEHSNCGI